MELENYKNHGYNAWYPKKYPRSQDFKDTVFWQEINTIQVASRYAVLKKEMGFTIVCSINTFLCFN